MQCKIMIDADISDCLIAADYLPNLLELIETAVENVLDSHESELYNVDCELNEYNS